MNLRFLHIAILTAVLPWAASCTREKAPDVDGNDAVEVSLQVENPSSDIYTMKTKATPAEERALKNMYVYIFSKNGALKGFAAFNGGLDQSTSDTEGKYGSITVRTIAGNSYIYAVANVFQEGTYPLKTTMKDGINETITLSDGLPINLSQEAVLKGNVNFTREQFLALPFIRKPGTIQVSSSFLMTGATNRGNAVYINKDGAISGNEDIIRLTRVVSKVRFNIGIAKGSTGKTFKAEKYSIVNVACTGSLFSSDDAGAEKTYSVEPVQSNFNDISGIFAPNDVDASGRQYFEVYLPENKQDAVNEVSKWHDREADGMSVPKKFANAPEFGTYVVIHGTYTEQNSSYTRDAAVSYTVHLGDCSADVNDYNVERNSSYTFNVSISGVDNIIVEAKQENDTQEQPGSEGVVMEYGTSGKTLSLDSHYEHMVMRFWQNDIKILKEKGLGYIYKISDLGRQSDVMMVTDKVAGNLNGADTDWVEFAIGGTYSSEPAGRGTAVAYPGKGKPSLYTIDSFLKLLYDNAFGLENYIIDQFAKALSNAEEDAFLNGDGVGKPLGLFSDKGGGEVAVTAASATAITADEIINLVYSLKRPYRKNAKFIMNDQTIAALRKLKDNNGAYLWQPSFQAGEVDRLFGYEVYTSPYVPTIATGKPVIAFGDFSYYNIGDRGTRSFAELKELYAGNGMVGFVAKERVDGKLILTEAVQILKMKAGSGSSSG